MSDVMLRFPACFAAGKCSLPSSGIHMATYARDVEEFRPEDTLEPEYVLEKRVRPWLVASQLSLLGEEDVA